MTPWGHIVPLLLVVPGSNAAEADETTPLPPASEASQPRLPSCDEPEGRGDVTEFAITPTRVEIGLSYGGAAISASAEVAAGAQYALVLTGARTSLKLKRKGKVWGVLWMSTGELELHDVPSAYLVATSALPDALAPPQELARHAVGFAGLADAFADDRDDSLELIKLKQQDGVYGEFVSGIAITPSANGRARLSATLPISPRVAVGEYTVRLISFRDGVARCETAVPILLERTGLARALHALAMEQGWLYGWLAVVIAVAAGILTGVLFGRGASKGH